MTSTVPEPKCFGYLHNNPDRAALPLPTPLPCVHLALLAAAAPYGQRHTLPILQRKLDNSSYPHGTSATHAAPCEIAPTPTRSAALCSVAPTPDLHAREAPHNTRIAAATLSQY